MPWTTPTLRQVREMTRDNVTTALSGAAMIANSVLRVMSDAMSALAHLTLRYIDWLSLQLLPDTAEKEWLDRHGDIWLVNADGSTGRKLASFAYVTAEFVGTIAGTIVPIGTHLEAGNVTYETTENIALSTASPTVGKIRAREAGAVGNLPTGDVLSFVAPPEGADSNPTVRDLTGGADEENDDELRA